MLYENWKRKSDNLTTKEVADTIDDILLDYLIDGEKIVKFNEELFIDVLDNIRDICQELKDDGFSVNIYEWDKYVFICKRISTGQGSYLGEFSYREVSEVVERLKEYLGDKFLKVEGYNARHVDKIFKDRKLNGDDTLNGIRIYFK